MKTSLLSALPLSAALILSLATAAEPVEQQPAKQQSIEKHLEVPKNTTNLSHRSCQTVIETLIPC